MDHRKYRIKVPTGIFSRKEDVESPVAFKNMTNDIVSLYWIDHNGKAKFYADLGPVKRNEVGFRIKTFQTHPWVVVQNGKRQLLMNGKRYFLPPNPNAWKYKPNKWLQDQFILPSNEDINESATPCTNDNEDEQFYEVLINHPGCIALRTLCLIKCGQLFPTKQNTAELRIPNNLIHQIEQIKDRLFYKL